MVAFPQMDHKAPHINREDTVGLFYYHNSFKIQRLFAKQIQLLNLFSLPRPAYTRSRQRAELAEKPAGSTTSQDREGSTMKSEETRRLCRDELIRLDGDVAGRVISCRKGILWLTQTGNPGDHLIRTGEAFEIERPGVVLISALEESLYTVSGGRRSLLLATWPFISAIPRMVRRFEAAKKSLLA
jgi:hypothetical protein